jgi:hypothetical protein
MGKLLKEPGGERMAEGNYQAKRLQNNINHKEHAQVDQAASVKSSSMDQS